MEPTQIRLTIPDSVDPTRLMGPADSLLRRIEQAFDAMVVVRGNTITISGAIEVVEQASTVFSRLMRQVEVGENPTVDDVDVLIEHVKHGAAGYSILSDDVLLTYRGRTIRPKTAGQKRYIDSIRSNTITFGIGPAGTGKTYLARIVLCRPVVEAGESLGFLPGTLEEKLDPYVRPLYDALFDMTDMEKGNALIEQGVIEIAPLAFMRGRTLNDAFVILDEAQNTTPEQMKMFLTRLGFSSKFVVTGDATQRDLLGKSGLDQAREVLDGIEGISFIDLDRNDIVRHSLVARIVDAFARGEGGGKHDARDR